MSHQLVNHSPDLKKLRDEGYDVEVRSNYLLIKNVPYVNSSQEVKLGTLVSELTLAGDVTTVPSTHVVMFSGDYPCQKDGSEIAQIKNSSEKRELDRDLVINHTFSNKPSDGYKNYFEKMTRYVDILSHPAYSIDPTVTARIFPVIESKEEDSVFNYIDTASSRADINAISRKLELGKIAIVGLGGTGSYVLDLIAKTPVREIHLFDGDKFSQHNAFRAPGAPSIAELKRKLRKVTFFRRIYSRMHRNIFAHGYNIDSSTVDQLREMDFIFLCLDKGAAKKAIIIKLEEFNIPFIDVGMGIEENDGSLGGILRVTTSTVKQREHVGKRIPFSDDDENNDYPRNIQVADLNALNAALAVMKWKKLLGFYRDFENEFHSTYTIDCSMLLNEDKL